MFDIKKAIEASFNAHKDPNRRLHLMRFLMRAACGSGLVTQWRSVGRDYEIIDLFLKDLGFTKEDYQVHESVLDKAVHDFRWVESSSKYVNFVNEVRAPLYREKFGDVIMMIYKGNNQDVGMIYDNVASTGVNRPIEPTPFDISRITQDRIAQFKKAVEESSEANDEDRNLVRALTEDDAAIPNLAFIEYIVRYLGLVPTERDSMFDSQKSLNNCRKTVFRHMTNGVICPSNDILASTIPAFEYDLEGVTYSRAGQSSANEVIRKFFCRTREQAAKVTGQPVPILISAFEPVRSDMQAKILVQSSKSLRDFWGYIGSLYSAFFNCHVVVSGASRVGIHPEFEAWKASARNSRKEVSDALRDLHFVSSGDVVGIMFTAFLSHQDAPLRAMPIVTNSEGKSVYMNNAEPAHPKFAFADETASSYHVSEMENTAIARSELPTEWYSLTHHNGMDFSGQSADVPSYFWGYHKYYDTKTLTKFKQKAAGGIPNRARLIQAINPSLNDAMKIKFSGGSSSYIAVKNVLSSTISGISAALKSQLSDVEYGAWQACDEDEYTDAHSTTSVVAAVYSAIPGEGSYFDRVVNNANTKEQFTKLIKYMPVHQHELPSSGDLHKRGLIIETNVKFDAALVPEKLKGLIGGVLFSNIVLRGCAPEIGVIGTPAARGYDFRMAKACYEVASRYNNIAEGHSRHEIDTGDLPVREWGALYRALRSCGRTGLLSGSSGDSGQWDLSNPDAWNTWGNDYLEIQFRNDTFGRLYIIVVFSKEAADSALMQFRIARKLPWFDANLLALIKSYDPSIIRIGAREDDHSALTTAVECLMRHQEATDFGALGAYERFYGYGPWFKTHRVNQYRPMVKGEYIDRYPHVYPTDYASSARHNPMYDGLFSR